MAIKNSKIKTVKFEDIDVGGVIYNEITIKAPSFGQVKKATKHVKTTGADADGRPNPFSLDEINDMFGKFVELCGESPSGPVVAIVVDELPYNVVSELGSFCMSFM